jgi:Protein of unknown function (DUF669)
MAQLDFDTDGIEPMQPLGALPAGTYDFVIADTEIKESKSGRGSYLQVVSNVVGGEMDGRKLFDRFNIQHENKQAEEIGRRQLSALCHAIGLLQVADSDEMLGREFRAEVKIDRNKETGAEGNKVAAYIAKEGAPPAPKAAAKPAAAPAGKAPPPWAKKAVAA